MTFSFLRPGKSRESLLHSSTSDKGFVCTCEAGALDIEVLGFKRTQRKISGRSIMAVTVQEKENGIVNSGSVAGVPATIAEASTGNAVVEAKSEVKAGNPVSSLGILSVSLHSHIEYS